MCKFESQKNTLTCVNCTLLVGGLGYMELRVRMDDNHIA